MDIRYGPIFHITLLLNPKLALWIVSQLHPNRHPHNVKFIVNGDDDKPFIIEYDERNGVAPTDEQIEKVILLFENSLKLSPGVRGVRFDVSFVSDTAVINLEMQRSLEKYLDYRMHLSSSQIMVFQSESGMSFNELTPVYVTFICVNDPYGLGLRKYTWETHCLEAPGLSQTYAPQWVVYNAEGIYGDVSANIEELLEYFRNPNAYDVASAKNPLIRELHEAARKVMMDGRLRQMISTINIREQSLVVNARDEGYQVATREMAKKMRDRGEPEEKVLDYTGFSFKELDKPFITYFPTE